MSNRANNNENFFPFPVENAAAAAFLRDTVHGLPLDTRSRTLPRRLPGLSVDLDGRPLPENHPFRAEQIFESWVPIIVDSGVAAVLSQFNTLNRKKSATNTARLADAMLRNQWLFNGQSSQLICTNRELLNGQHTFDAVILSAEIAAAQGTFVRPIIMIPVIGFSTDVFATQDDGRARTTRDTLVVGEKHGKVSLRGVPDNEVSNALRVMLQFINITQNILPDNPLFLPGIRAKVPNYRAPQLLNHFPQLIESLEFCNEISSFKTSKAPISIAVAGVLHAIISEVQSVTAANNFVRSLISGANLDETSPIYKLREQLLSDNAMHRRLEGLDKLAMSIRAWNMVAKHQTPSRARIKALSYQNGELVFPLPQPISRTRNRDLVR